MKPDPRLLAVALLATALVACDSDGTIVDNLVGGEPIVTETAVVGASDAASASLLNFTMPDINGGSRRDNAVVLIPAGDAPAGGWPVIGWGHGTVGVADACAPSASDNLSGYDTYLNAWLASGFAIVAPDYEGLGTEGGHPYLHLDSEGRSINYAVAAATEAFPELSSQYALLGHSQGGHAVLGAASLSDENPEISLVGAVAMAPASQILEQGNILKGIFTNDAASDEERIATAIGNLGFSTLIAHGIETAIPEFDLDAAYGPNGAPIQALVETTCLPRINEELNNRVPPFLLFEDSVDSFISPDLNQDENLLTYFESVEPGSRLLGAPLFIAQGLSDTVIFPNSTIALQAQLAEVSDEDIDPTIMTYMGSDHSGVLDASFNDALTFITAQFAAAQ